MGNKLCKKKTDVVDNANNTSKTTPTPFDRIINRLHLRPNSWKSESQLNHQKQVSRSTSNFYVPTDEKKSHSKSTDWTEVGLEVPHDDEEAIHLRNPKLSLIFADSKSSTPTPPPRKHKKGLREKIEAVAKSGLQAFQQNANNNRKPVEEPLCVKKFVKPTNPDDHNCTLHHTNHNNNKNAASLHDDERKKGNLLPNNNNNKEAKRRKNLSVVSLPNYNELKLTVANFDDDNIDKKPADQNGDSMVSLPTDGKKLTHTASTGKLDACMTRCRSFGSLLPQQFLDKLRVKKITTDIESDDSFGGLEDWDLKLIEHYNPKDASLPRPRKLQQKNPSQLQADIESLIVQADDEEAAKPVVPARRSESLLKKINREASETARKSHPAEDGRCVSVTPPPSPTARPSAAERTMIRAEDLPVEENGRVEHSSLMKILEEFSIKDKQQQHSEQFKKNVASVQEFLNNEKKIEC